MSLVTNFQYQSLPTFSKSKFGFIKNILSNKHHEDNSIEFWLEVLQMTWFGLIVGV